MELHCCSDYVCIETGWAVCSLRFGNGRCPILIPRSLRSQGGPTLLGNDAKAQMLSKPALSALHYLQLLSAHEAARFRSGAGNARAPTRKGGSVVWMRLTGYMIMCIPLYDIKGSR